MHRSYVSPSVQRKRFVGGQSSANSGPDNIQTWPSAGTLGQCQKHIVHAGTVAEVQDTAPALEAPRIHPAFNGEVRITKQGVVAHIDVVHIPLEGHTE